MIPIGFVNSFSLYLADPGSFAVLDTLNGRVMEV